MKHKIIVKVILILLSASLVLLSSCQGGQHEPVIPDTSPKMLTDSGRYLWGLWEMEVIPDGNGSARVELRQLRGCEFHVNVVGIMESSGKPAVGIEPPVTLANNVLDVKVKLTHPFSITKFTGFDVRGILIGHASVAGFSDSLMYAGSDDMKLLNADGHTRLWNPTEYTGKGYVDGKMSKPDAIANYTATLNGYKYFASGLTSDMAVRDMVKKNRGAFLAGSTNVRRYRIKLGNKGLSFQYAIDANWSKPTEPVKVPDSFDVNRANCPEPYHIDVRVGPGIWGGGGTADVTVDVYDWQKDVTVVYAECPLLKNGVIELTNPVDMGDFVRFSGTITNELLPSANSADLLFYARGTDPDSKIVYTDYRLFHLPLTRVPPGGVIITLQDDMAYKTIGVKYIYGGSDYDWAGGNPAPVDYNDVDGPWDFTPVPNNSSGERVALAKTDPEVAAFANDFKPAVTHFFKTEWMFNDQVREVFQAEQHDQPNNRLRLWGVYEKEDLQGSVPFEPPIDFPYPMNITTYYKVSKTYNIIPLVLTLNIQFERWGVGQGVVFIPLEPGINGWGWESYAALVTRTIAKIATGGALGQGPLGTALIYEWIADNGTTVATIISGNAPDEPPNFNESTFQIIGAGGAAALRSIK